MADGNASTSSSNASTPSSPIPSSPMNYAGALRTDAEINKLRLEDVRTYAKNITKTFQSFYQHLFDPVNGVIPKLQSQLAVSQRVNETLMSQLHTVERDTISNSQYARRESLELHGVPESFDNGPGLEANVISLINDIAPDADITPDDLQAVHRLKTKRNVIVKFASRKKKHAVITKRKNLKDDESIKRRHNIQGQIYLNESMCYQVNRLHYFCRQLKKRGKLVYYTFFNGSLRVKTETEGTSTVIGHINDLVKLTGMTRNDIENLKN